MREFSLEFGVLARPMAIQLPMLSKAQADHFDADNMAIARARARGYISDAELAKIHRRLAAAIGDALADRVPSAKGAAHD